LLLTGSLLPPNTITWILKRLISTPAPDHPHQVDITDHAVGHYKENLGKEKDRWELKITGPQDFERSYKLEENVRTPPEIIRQLLVRVLPPRDGADEITSACGRQSSPGHWLRDVALPSASLVSRYSPRTDERSQVMVPATLPI